jgi:hypothetical protein
MQVNFLRLASGQIALFYLKKMAIDDARVMMRTSSNEGKTWSFAIQLSPSGKYTVLTNGRCLRLSSGRILVEAAGGPDDAAYCHISDDDGKTWRYSKPVPRPAQNGWVGEGACIELKDGGC